MGQSEEDEAAVLGCACGAQGEVKRLTERVKELSDLSSVCRQIERLNEERDTAKRDLSLLADSMVYRGNSVSFIYDKMACYRDQVDLAFNALRALGWKPGTENGNIELRAALLLWANSLAAKVKAFEAERWNCHDCGSDHPRPHGKCPVRLGDPNWKCNEEFIRNDSSVQGKKSICGRDDDHSGAHSWYNDCWACKGIAGSHADNCSIYPKVRP